MTALIDADSLVYVIGYNFRDSNHEDAQVQEEVKANCDLFLRDILTMTGAEMYLGVFSVPSAENFRTALYKYSVYKGNRGEKPEYMTRWEDVIKSHYIMQHGFFVPAVPVEADDVLAAVAHEFTRTNKLHVICSPDKDLRQVPGVHYDYRRKTEEGQYSELFHVSEEEAYWNFWTQMLTGDSGDCVAGIPGMGEVKARKFIQELKENCSKVETAHRVLGCYRKYFGDYYGDIIFKETLHTLRLLCPLHPLYGQYEKAMLLYSSTAVKELRRTDQVFE
jgi:5'-3' exonuclease